MEAIDDGVAQARSGAVFLLMIRIFVMAKNRRATIIVVGCRLVERMVA
jgi:hypothetical protein